MSNGVVLKKRNERGVIQYKFISGTEASNYLKLKSKIISNRGFITILPNKLLSDSEFVPFFAHYDEMDIYSSNPNFLNRFRLPQGTLMPNLGQSFIEFWRTRIENTDALEELFSSHSYRFRNPEVFIEKAFIQYDPLGGAGKSTLSYMLGLMYG
jgi:hypothetical protein